MNIFYWTRDNNKNNSRQRSDERFYYLVLVSIKDTIVIIVRFFLQTALNSCFFVKWNKCGIINIMKEVIIVKQGNQFYLEFQIEDENGTLLDTASILKVQFAIGDLIKTYDGVGDEVIYDSANKIFKVWVTEEETFKFDKQVKMDARVLFKGEENYRPIGGTYIESNYWYDSLKQEVLDV